MVHCMSVSSSLTDDHILQGSTEHHTCNLVDYEYDYLFLRLNHQHRIYFVFFFNDPAPPEIYPLPLPDALPIYHLIVGDDGGVWYSYDGGNRWWEAENLPVSQVYHVSVDMDRPYHVYGGLQDNSSWVGDSSYPGGITNDRWENMYGGDGFWMFVDPSDPDYIYAEAQGGEIGRVNRKTHETRNIKPVPNYKEAK